MAKFKTKPFIIEALLFTGDNEDEIKKMCAQDFWLLDTASEDDPEIVAEIFDKLHSTWVGVKPGQWIIKGQKGEFYPCDPDIFAAKYEQIDDEEVYTVVQKGEYIVSSDTVRRWADDGGK